MKVIAAADGTVTRSTNMTGFGQVIFIKHTVNGKSYETVYAHLRTGSRQFSVGNTVKQGQFIGYMGSTGKSDGQHLHFEILENNYINPKNPENYINF